jgi:energy-coupling factor transporter ATP-binding protein EcfA2
VGRLAAVDMHTAQHLVQRALSGPLAQDRTIILVTHHIRLCLPYAAYVVELGDGKIVRQGTPEELDHLGVLEAVIEDEDTPTAPGDATAVLPENEADIDEKYEEAKPVPARESDGKLVEQEARAEGRG